jgi:CHAT domain-containing protein
VLPNRLLIIRSGFLSLSFDTKEVTRLKLRELVQRWHLAVCRGRPFDPLTLPAQRERARHLLAVAAAGHAPRAGYGESLEELGEELAEALSLPSVARWVRALTIVPDDSLHGFPFAAVRYRGRYLVERFALSLAFESGEGRPAADTHGAGEALLVAVPQGASAAELPGGPVDVPALRGTVAELRKVRAWLTRKRGLRVRRLDGVAERATKETVLGRLPSAALFHAACHGFSNVERPEQAGLLLVPREGEVELLTLRELAGLDLPALQHVTLSSCWSADNFVLPGRWIISLPETFWRAGARSVLGSLWEVKDDVAVAFMKRFYRALDHHPRDQALQLTQLACLKRRLLPRQPESHPINSEAADAVNWAGYNLYGDYRHLRLGGRHSARERLGLLRHRAPGEGRKQ